MWSIAFILGVAVATASAIPPVVALSPCELLATGQPRYLIAASKAKCAEDCEGDYFKCAKKAGSSMKQCAEARRACMKKCDNSSSRG